MKNRWPLILICVLLAMSRGNAVYAAFDENIAVGSAKAWALGNSVTANPPGAMSAHYNPAGLSLMPEGQTLDQGFALIRIERSVRFEADPNFSILNDTWGPNAPRDPNDPPGKIVSYSQGPDPVAGTSGTNDKSIIYVPIPAIGALHLPVAVGATLGIVSRKPKSRWTFAYTNYAAHGGGFDHDKTGDPAVYDGKYFYLQHMIYAAPTVSYQLADNLSVGLSVGAGQTAFGVEIYGRAPNEIAAITRVLGDATKDLNIPVISQETLPGPWFGGGTGPYDHSLTIDMVARDDFSPSYNVGLLWQAQKWLTFGVVYQSETRSQVSGKYKFTYSDQFRRTIDWNNSTPMTMQNAGMLDLPYQSVPYQSGSMTSEFVFPQRVQLGFMFQPVQKLRWMVDFHWANWAALKEDRFDYDEDIQFLKVIKLLGWTHGDRTIVLRRDMKDTWHWSTGIEYDVKDNLTLRAGWEPRPTSRRNDLWNLSSFLPDVNLLGLGATIKLPKGPKIDIGLMYLFGKHETMNNESTNSTSTDPTYIGSNPYTGLNYYEDLSLYALSIGITKPLAQQKEEVDEILHKVEKVGQKVKKVFKVLNPFGKKGKTY